MPSSTTTRTVVGVFDDYAAAQRVVSSLVEEGFNRNNIEITSNDSYMKNAARGNAGLSGAAADSSGGGISGFFRRMFGDDLDETQSGYYSEAVRRGSTVVIVNADDNNAERAADLMDDQGAIDIDRRAAAWQQSGFQSFDVNAAPYTEAEIARERELYKSDVGDRSIPVVREELQVGKRSVNRGGVRVINRVREVPVEEQVRLREEHVRVDRRPVDRAATEADLRGRDEVIEVTEMAEEAVIGKRARVVEEVVIGKETRERTETVRDTVRQTEVDVEEISAGSPTTDYDNDFRQHFKQHYGAAGDAQYESYAPGYQFGSRMASDKRYQGKRWEDLEPTFRSEYERSYPGSAWENFKDSVRYGWDKVTGRR